ncbi:hypothetical protein [Sphingomonas japonica]|uniref:hypothetical protein n=1 Tax=Sphingomonas japonica TaxID=511662 RepID=UPI001ABABE2D|nr:hypothetical protein [Sphingomonas japonica]
MLRPRLPWLLCLAAGVGVLLASAAFGRVPGLVPCGPAAELGAIIAFELARSASEVAALFGAEPCRSALIAAQRQAVWVDALAFIPAYALFLGSAAWGLRKDRRIAPLTIAMVAAAAVLDQIEGRLLWSILDAMPGTEATLLPLYGVVRVKFALLSLAAFALAALLLRRGRIATIAAVVVAGGALLSFATLVVNAHHPLLMEGHRISWTALLIVAGWFAVRPPGEAR